MEKYAIITIYAFIALLLYYGLVKLMNRSGEHAKDDFSDIINSEKYKVKGQYD